MKKTNVAILIVTLLLTCNAFAQEEIHSGIVHTTTSGEASNLIKLDCEGMTPDMASTIRNGCKKYTEIRSVDFQVYPNPTKGKLYVEFSLA